LRNFQTYHDISRHRTQKLGERKFTVAGSHPFVHRLAHVGVHPRLQRGVAELDITDLLRPEPAQFGGAVPGAHPVHGVHRQSKLGPADVFDGGQYRVWITDRHARCYLDGGPDAALRGHLGQRRQLVEGAVAVRVETERVDLGGPEFGHDVQLGAQVGHIGPRHDHQALAQGDADAAVIHRGEQAASELHVILE
jgi:hypothetical protein